MPLFALISGYYMYQSMQAKPMGQYLKKQFLQLIVPMFCWTVLMWVYYIIRVLLCNECNLFEFTHLKVLVHNFLYQYWFLWAIFVASFVILIVKKYCKDRLWVYLSIVLLSLFLTNNNNIYLYVFTFPYFLVGYLVNKYKFVSKKSNSILLLLLSGFTFIILICLYTNDIYVYISQTRIFPSIDGIRVQLYRDLFRWLIGGIGCFFCYFCF